MIRIRLIIKNGFLYEKSIFNANKDNIISLISRGIRGARTTTKGKITKLPTGGKPKTAQEVRDALVAGEKVTIKYSNVNLNDIIKEVVSEPLSNKSGPEYMNPSDVHEKLQEISGEIQVLTAMLKGRLIN